MTLSTPSKMSVVKDDAAISIPIDATSEGIEDAEADADADADAEAEAPAPAPAATRYL